MRKRHPLLLALLFVATGLLAQRNIFINQVGYRPQDRKDFRLNAVATSFELLDDSGTVVYRGEIVKQKNQDKGALEDVWIGDFSSFAEEGQGYRIRLNGGAVSDPFDISGKLYDEIFQTALRGLYVTRCTYAVRDDVVGHGVCHADAGKFVVQLRNNNKDTTYVPDGRGRVWRLA